MNRQLVPVVPSRIIAGNPAVMWIFVTSTVVLSVYYNVYLSCKFLAILGHESFIVLFLKFS